MAKARWKCAMIPVSELSKGRAIVAAAQRGQSLAEFCEWMVTQSLATHDTMMVYQGRNPTWEQPRAAATIPESRRSGRPTPATIFGTPEAIPGVRYDNPTPTQVRPATTASGGHLWPENPSRGVQGRGNERPLAGAAGEVRPGERRALRHPPSPSAGGGAGVGVHRQHPRT